MKIIFDDINLVATELLHEIPAWAVKTQKATGLETEKIPALLVETLRFLELAQLYSPQPLTPSHRVDLAWHEFILFTRTYSRFCQTYFGGYLHHQPDDNRPANVSNFKKTLSLYLQTYQCIPPFYFWGA